MSNEFEALERDAAIRIVSLYPPKSIEATVARIERLQGDKGLAIASIIADLDQLVAGVRRREGFSTPEFRLQLIGQLGLTAEDLRLHDSVLDKRIEVEFDLDA